MCGRFMLKSSIDEIAGLFDVDQRPNLRPRYNIAPTQDTAVVRNERVDSGNERVGRELAMLRFGLVPHWADDPKVGYKMINARGETVHRLPSFRDAYKKRRCLIPTDGFFEWQAVDGSEKAPKQPFLIRRRDQQPFAFAGIFERWQSKGGAETIESFAIVTTSANRTLAPIHHRMPVVLDSAAYATWLDPTQDARPLLAPCPEDWLEPVMIGQRINKPANDDPSVLTPVDQPITPAQGSLF
ncbi:MAG: SOS response-associated peptidase [Alphaproteobacteria bacterium]|nr:SOS response-associated peptidase [Alphaproteobacteria bacterium]